jgi:hypothetical protein
MGAPNSALLAEIVNILKTHHIIDYNKYTNDVYNEDTTNTENAFTDSNSTPQYSVHYRK